jgi:hypothetical protein
MSDPVLERLAALPPLNPPPELSRAIRRAAHARLAPTKVHPLWGVAVAASVLLYMSWALLYTAPF